MSWERMTRLASSPFTRTASATTSRGWRRGAAPQRDRVGNGARGDAARRDDGDPGCATIRSRDVRDDAQRIARDRLDPLFGAADGDRDARRRDDEARDRAPAALNRNTGERTLR